MPEAYDPLAFELEHIVPRKHGGTTVLENLAWACFPCNRHKGPNLTGIDPETRQIAPLFHPRRDRWEDHFQWQEMKLVGKTPTGRATVEVLRINLADRAALRRSLMDEGVFLPAAQ